MKTKLLTIIFCCILSSTFGQFTFDSCLVAYYPFNGNAHDESINENNGILFGPTLTADRFDQDSSAYSFDGVDDYIVISDDSTLNPENITLCAWYKTVSFEGIGNNAIIDKAFSSHVEPFYQYHIGVTGDLYTVNGWAKFQTDLSVDTILIKHITDDDFWIVDEWYFLCSSYDGSYYRTYINGTLFDSTYSPGTITSYGVDLYIGKFGNLEYATPGVIDDIRIYNCALDSNSIQELYDEVITHIDKIENEVNVKIYPNPTRQYVHIDADEKISKIIIRNSMGTAVRTYYSNIETINLINLANGIYIIHFYDENKNLIRAKKIIKQ